MAYFRTHSIFSPLSETLCCELAERGSKIKVSVLCPAWVKTQILNSERNRSPAMQNPPLDRAPSAAELAMQQALEAGMAPQDVVGLVSKAIQGEQFYILPDPTLNALIQQRLENILHGRTPI